MSDNKVKCEHLSDIVGTVVPCCFTDYQAKFKVEHCVNIKKLLIQKYVFNRKMQKIAHFLFYIQVEILCLKCVNQNINAKLCMIILNSKLRNIK